MKLSYFYLIIFIVFPLLSYDPAYTRSKNELPLEVKDLKIQEKTGTKINTELTFLNEEGKQVKLGNVFNNKVVLLTIVYYRCPTLCGYHLQGLMATLKDLEWTVGKEFEFVAVSMDPTENSELALAKRNSFVEEYKKSSTSRGSSIGWHFLTGDEKSIKELADSVGFPYRYNSGLKQWIHPAVAYVITPEAILSRYLHGIAFDSKELKLSFMAAADGKLGSFIDKFTMFCYQFDPNKNKYTLYAYNLMKIGGLITVIILAAFLFSFYRSQTKNKLYQGDN
jgi:protein SCO1/2